MGKVIFVGGGIYDEAYLTLQGKQALEEADCVLYDNLLDVSLLKYTKGECVYVGKSCGNHYKTQDQINQLLVDKAREYECVVRLKGGDSFVFGRGGEEALYLQQYNISFSFIPGISSTIAVPELAGIPLTFRGISRGFQVLSAHLKKDELGITEDQVKDDKITLVIVMGLNRIEQIINLLYKAKRSPSTPIAIISKGGSPQQKVVCATLATILDEMKKYNMDSPAIVVIGKVVAFHHQLQTHHHLALQGKMIEVCTVQEMDNVLVPFLKKHGASVIVTQTGKIEYFTNEQLLHDIFEIDCFIFTSKHGIHAFMNLLQQAKIDLRNFYKKKFYVVGKKSYEVLAKYGIYADKVAEGFVASMDRLIYENLGFKYAHIGCDHSQPILVENANIQRYTVYKNVEINMQKESLENRDAICFSCASSVERYPNDLSNQLCFSIGHKTTQALHKRNAKQVVQASEPTYEALCDCIIKEMNLCIEEED